MKKLVILFISVLFLGCMPVFDTGTNAVGNAVEGTERASRFLQSWVDGPYYDYGYDNGAGDFYIEVNYHCVEYYGNVNDITASVYSDEVLVGGYAYTLGYDPGLHRGVFLNASHPVLDASPTYGADANGKPCYYDAKSWRGRSRGAYNESNPHYLVVVAVGMRLHGVGLGTSGNITASGTFVKREILRDRMRYTQSDWSGVSSHPQNWAYTFPGYDIIGGGAEVLDNGGAGNFLTDTFGNFDAEPFYWYVKSKDHLIECQSQIRAYTIAIVKNPNAPPNLYSVPKWGNFNKSRESAGVWVPSGRGTATALKQEGRVWPVIVGVGGRTTWDGNSGRMISGMLITENRPADYRIAPNNSVTVEGQDYGVADSGVVAAQSIGLYKDAGDPNSTK